MQFHHQSRPDRLCCGAASISSCNTRHIAGQSLSIGTALTYQSSHSIQQRFHSAQTITATTKYTSTLPTKSPTEPIHEHHHAPLNASILLEHSSLCHTRHVLNRRFRNSLERECSTSCCGIRPEQPRVSGREAIPQTLFAPATMTERLQTARNRRRRRCHPSRGPSPGSHDLLDKLGNQPNFGNLCPSRLHADICFCV